MPELVVDKTYTAITATGAKASLAIAGSARVYSLQVKGTGAAATSWNVTLEGSLDNANWTTLLTHNSIDGGTTWTDSMLVKFVRVNVVALTLGSATDISVFAVAAP